MSPQSKLREHQVPVDLDLEGAARRLDQLDLGVGERIPELCRQTGGSGLVVSDDAVGNRDDHGLPRFRKATNLCRELLLMGE